MKTLHLGSAHKCPVIGLYENDCIIHGIASLSQERQSETISLELMRLMKEASWDSSDIDEVAIIDGPGSYTSVRIAICVVKVLHTRKYVPLYAVPTLQLYAGIHERAFVMLNVRNQHAYTGTLQGDKSVEGEQILALDEIHLLLNQTNHQLFGDCELIDLRAKEPKLLENFVALRPPYRKIGNVHTLTPRYLKESDTCKVES